jgi:hypothetical protein
MSEAGPGNTTYTPIPRHAWAVFAAAISWGATVTVAILDITDQFPRAIVFVIGTTAGCATVIAGLLWFDSITRARYAGLTEGVGELARQVEQISAKVPDAESAFDAGRRYAESTTGHERPGPRALRDI